MGVRITMKKEYYDKKSFNKILSKVDKKSRAMPRVKKLMKEIDVLSKKAEPGSTADKKKGIAIFRYGIHSLYERSRFN